MRLDARSNVQLQAFRAAVKKALCDLYAETGHPLTLSLNIVLKHEDYKATIQMKLETGEQPALPWEQDVETNEADS